MRVSMLWPLLLSGCGFGFSERSSWRDQLVADSPCYRVDILNGLDEEDTTEFEDLFGCVNHSGHVDPLVPVVASLSAEETRAGAPAALDLAHLVNTLPDADVDPFALAGLALDALQAENRPFEALLDVGLELIYGVPAADLRGGSVSLRDGASLATGVLVPIGALIPEVSTVLLDSDLAGATWAADLLADPELHRWLATFGALIESEDAEVSALASSLLPGVGDAILATRSPGNDRWPAASGDSVRDLVRTFDLVDAGNEVAPPLVAMLSDLAVRTSVRGLIDARGADGTLALVPEQTKWLADVDIDGGSLQSGEDSGLYALLRLLHDTNQPMSCSLDLWVTSLSVNFGNLAVVILELLASQSPDNVQGLSGLLGDAMGFPGFETVMGEVAESGLCPVFSPQVAADLQAIDLLASDETYELLVVLMDLLDLLQSGQNEVNHIESLVDLASAFYAFGLVPPLEELVRDIGDAPLMADVMVLSSVLLRPEDYVGDQIADPVDMDDGLELLLALLDEDPATGEPVFAGAEAVAKPIIASDGTWKALEAAGRLLVDDRSQLSRGLELVPPLMALDPEFESLIGLAPLLGDERVSAPLLRVLEAPAVTAGLFAVNPQGDDQDVPLAFVSRLIVDGTLDDVLRIVDLVLGSLEEE